ncbi:MAG: aspartate carbamoyltransferase regulatory subunit [Candidatus Lokiarchaeota archaeon]|nr:aspartate carbamoyltransferase regulatory subunit [Candidatus Lokiarchaeota archaeon]
MVEKSLRVQKINNGTVIDHINSGMALKVLKILGIKGEEGDIVSILMNVPSGHNHGHKKDIVKVENREIKIGDIDKIALISPKATINFIQNFEVIKKEKVKIPKEFKGIIKCRNPNCISNSREPIKSYFKLEKEEPLLIKCDYCSVLMDKNDILDSI